jgi:ethanolamine transporter EutH
MELSPPGHVARDGGASDGGILAASFMLAAAALVHLALAPEHFAQWWLLGVLFGAAAALQLALAIALVRRPGRTPIAWACALNVGIVAVWLLSRTAGTPFGPDSGAREPIGWLDMLTTLDELIVVALLSIEVGWTAWQSTGRLATGCRIAGTGVALVLTLAFAGGVGHD